MAPGIKLDKQVFGFLKDHLRLRKKNGKIQLVWREEGEFSKKIYNTVLSEIGLERTNPHRSTR